MCNSPSLPTAAWRHSAVRHVRGFTLPEALIAIVVIGVGLTGVLLAFGSVARHSGEPVLRQQMLAVAEALMEEIQLKPYAIAANAAAAGCARATFNDISDYNGYSSSGICSIDGVAVAALAAYSVQVSVLPATLDGVAAARRITVTASHGGEQMQLVSWRTDYAAP